MKGMGECEGMENGGNEGIQKNARKSGGKERYMKVVKKK